MIVAAFVIVVAATGSPSGNNVATGASTSDQVQSSNSTSTASATPTASAQVTGTVSVTPSPTATQVLCPPAGCPFQLNSFLTPNPTGTPAQENIWYGQTPPGGGLNQPVLLFVHGLTGIAQDWWSSTPYSGVNDMYLLAYNAGYRTAFVTLQPCGCRGSDQSIENNGITLASQIKTVVGYYHVSQVVLITHSEGGVDAQQAVVSDGAQPYVSQVFMLSPPNWGSPLATLQCTTPGQPMCQLQPNAMTQYRQSVDPYLPDGVVWWGAGGTDHGPPGSFLSTAGQELSGMVPTDNNDGFVTVASATGQLQVPNVPGTGTPTKTPLPGTPTPTATPGPASQSLPWLNYLFVANVNHDSIRVGHNSFSYIQALLQRGTPVATAIVGPIQTTPVMGVKSTPAGG